MLVAYYSKSGNTEKVAREIAAETGGTLEVSSTGFAAETYVHRHFAEKARPMKKEDALCQFPKAQTA